METTSPIRINKPKPGRYSGSDGGMMVVPGTYSVEILSEKDGVIKQLIAPTNFKIKGLNNQTLIAQDQSELLNFRKEVAELKRSVDGSGKLISETEEKMKIFEHAICTYPGVPLNLLTEMDALKVKMNEAKVMLWGDWIRTRHEFEAPESISGRIGMVYYQLFSNTTGVTDTHRKNKTIVQEQYDAFRKELDDIIIRVRKIDGQLDELKIPYTQVKDERWKEE